MILKNIKNELINAGLKTEARLVSKVIAQREENFTEDEAIKKLIQLFARDYSVDPKYIHPQIEGNKWIFDTEATGGFTIDFGNKTLTTDLGDIDPLVDFKRPLKSEWTLDDLEDLLYATHNFISKHSIF